VPEHLPIQFRSKRYQSVLRGHYGIELSSYFVKSSMPSSMSILAFRIVLNPTLTNSAFGQLDELAKPAAW